MTQNVTPYEVSTALPPQAIPPEAKTKGTTSPSAPAAASGSAGEQGSDETLAPHEVRLSDGRVATLRETTGADDNRIEQFMGTLGYSLEGMGAMIYTRFRALAAVTTVDGVGQDPPMSSAQLAALPILYKSRDIARIIVRYNEINGEVNTEPTTFPG